MFDLAGKGRKLECSENPRYQSVSGVAIICAEVGGCIVCRGHFLCQAQPVRLKLLSLFSCVPGEGKDTPVANKEAELQWRGFHLSAAFIFGRLSSLYEDEAAVCLLVFSLPFTSSMTVPHTKTRAKPSISTTGQLSELIMRGSVVEVRTRERGGGQKAVGKFLPHRRFACV